MVPSNTPEQRDDVESPSGISLPGKQPSCRAKSPVSELHIKSPTHHSAIVVYDLTDVLFTLMIKPN